VIIIEINRFLAGMLGLVAQKFKEYIEAIRMRKA
jgi:hypothetical protein